MLHAIKTLHVTNKSMLCLKKHLTYANEQKEQSVSNQKCAEQNFLHHSVDDKMSTLKCFRCVYAKRCKYLDQFCVRQHQPTSCFLVMPPCSQIQTTNGWTWWYDHWEKCGHQQNTQEPSFSVSLFSTVRRIVWINNLQDLICSVT